MNDAASGPIDASEDRADEAPVDSSSLMDAVSDAEIEAETDGPPDADSPSDAGADDSGDADVIVPRCGNGVLELVEECDDGNDRDHDGCSRGCLEERPVWVEVPTLAAPRGQTGHHLAYDPIRGDAVFLGAGEPLGDATEHETWRYDGASWVNVGVLASPAWRCCGGLVWHEARGRLALFGGWPARVFGDFVFGDTWELDGDTWVERAFVESPRARRFHAMAYDSRRGRAVLFGGCGTASGCLLLDDTWELGADAWEPVANAGPTARYEHAMAFDASRGVTVLFGGMTESGTAGDTWEYDGAWRRIDVPQAPEPRRYHGMTYEAARRRVVLFGGSTDSGLIGDTWEYDGDAWVETSPDPSPTARTQPAMAYDSARGVTVLFGGGNDGGLEDTWEYQWRVP